MLIGLYTGLRTNLHMLRNERGASAVEYGLLVALIAVVIIISVGLLGTNLDAIFDKIAGEVGKAGGSGGSSG